MRSAGLNFGSKTSVFSKSVSQPPPLRYYRPSRGEETRARMEAGIAAPTTVPAPAAHVAPGKRADAALVQYVWRLSWDAFNARLARELRRCGARSEGTS